MKGDQRKMKKKNRFCQFTFNKRSILVLLIPVILLGTIIVVMADQKGIGSGKAQSAFQAKIPDGLYLYKPYFSRREGYSPLVLVKNKKLMDPYLVGEEKGYEAHLSKYVVGKTFDVYVGSERFGSLKELDLGFSYSSPCRRDEFIPNMGGRGAYEGKPLPSEWFIEKEMWGNQV